MRPPVSSGLVSIVGLIVGLASFVLDVLPGIWAITVIAPSAALLLLSVWWERAPESFARVALLVRDFLSHPLFLLAIVLAVFALSLVGVGYLRSIDDAVDCSRSVRIDPEQGGIFRAAEDHPARYPDGGRIAITPEPWEWPEVLPQEPVIAFSYREVVGRQRNEDESGGAHLRFYDDPVAISDFDSLSFAISGEKGDDGREVDVAVRLVVDDPTLPPGDREVVVREAPSLQELGHFLTDHWQRIAIDLGEFAGDPFLQAPDWVDPDKINKIAFFVNNDMLDRSPSGTVRMKDISFTRRSRSGACW